MSQSEQPPAPDWDASLRAMEAAMAPGLEAWNGWLEGFAPGVADKRDKRFAAPEWGEHPFFDALRRTYMAFGDHLAHGIEQAEVDEETRAKLRFWSGVMVDALSPANFPLTNPQVLRRTVETGGENLRQGLEHFSEDLKRGQLTHTARNAFELGRDIAATPGKVVRRTPLYELIQYSPTTEQVFETPLIIFPPWINRFYILDLGEKKSFVRWAVEQGITVFMVSWKSADENMAGTTLDDYVLRGQIDALDTVRELLGVPSAHLIGYCVAGTTLAATLAWLAAQGRADEVASATFFTAQVDFSEPGDLKHFLGPDFSHLLESGTGSTGVVDGRVMAATFNMLRGRDLVWSTVVNHYLLGEEHPGFDLLHWNGDVTNLPAGWHKTYLETHYKANKLVEPGGIAVGAVPIDLSTVRTPAYVQAGREDHIAPAESVWKITHHLSGPVRFVLAGSGHIAGVVNPPAANKYGYWINEGGAESLDAFIAGATENKGSWWPDWLRWIEGHDPKRVPATGARVPGQGSLPALEDAPGTYVRTR